MNKRIKSYIKRILSTTLLLVTLSCGDNDENRRFYEMNRHRYAPLPTAKVEFDQSTIDSLVNSSLAENPLAPYEQIMERDSTLTPYLQVLWYHCQDGEKLPIEKILEFTNSDISKDEIIKDSLRILVGDHGEIPSNYVSSGRDTVYQSTLDSKVKAENTLTYLEALRHGYSAFIDSSIINQADLSRIRTFMDQRGENPIVTITGEYYHERNNK